MTEKYSALSRRLYSRIQQADEAFKSWSRKFKCEVLESYYEGFQWKNVPSDFEPYVINLVYSTIKIKKPTLIFQRPEFRIEPRPNRADFNPEAAWQICQLQTDTLNTVVSKDYIEFAENIEMAILDSWFRFGLIEVGTAANYVENPNADLPALKEDYDETTEKGAGYVLRRAPVLPSSERIYVKRIPADRFRVGGQHSYSLRKCSWCGYFEYFRLSDILASGSGFINTSDLNIQVRTAEDTLYDEERNDPTQRGDLIKVWKIWDNRSKKMYMLCEVGPTVIYEKSFERLPLFDLRFDKRVKGWYPIPPVWNWKSAQDEQNETKEQLRAMRRRAKRLWQVLRDGIDEEEISKITAGPDGTVVTVNQLDAIRPIESPSIDASISTTLLTSKDDFNIISGTSSEHRGVADRQTATQSNIIENRAAIRESDERAVVAAWLCRIGKEILLQIRENFTESMWIQENTDIGALGQDYSDIQAKYRLISPITDLGDFDWQTFSYKDDFSVTIYVESLSPVVAEKEKMKFMEFLAIMQQYPMLSLNPVLIREAAYRVGYKNEQIIKAMQQAAVVQMIGQAAIAQGQQQSADSNLAQTTAEQMQPPSMGQLENQLSRIGTME